MVVLIQHIVLVLLQAVQSCQTKGLVQSDISQAIDHLQGVMDSSMPYFQFSLPVLPGVDQHILYAGSQ